MNGKYLHVTGRLLEQHREFTTNQYVCLDDATLSGTAVRVAVALHLKLCTHATLDDKLGVAYGCVG